MSENIIAGLISGVLATLLVFVFRSVWFAQIVPWFEERIYKDAHIEGTWFSLMPSTADNRQEVVTLERHGHAISGTLTCTSGGDEGEKYILAGSLRNMVLPLTYESANSAKTDRGTITLKLMRNGDRLVGKLAYYDTDEDSIDTTNIIWFRSKDDRDRVVADKEAHKKRIQELKEKSKQVNRELKQAEGISELPPSVTHDGEKSSEQDTSNG
jgi:hypothetical protein